MYRALLDHDKDWADSRSARPVRVYWADSSGSMTNNPINEEWQELSLSDSSMKVPGGTFGPLPDLWTDCLGSRTEDSHGNVLYFEITTNKTMHRSGEASRFGSGESSSPPGDRVVELKRVLGAAELFGSGAPACARPCLRRIVGIHANTQDFGAHPRLDPCPPLRTGPAQNHPPVLARARCGSLG